MSVTNSLTVTDCQTVTCQESSLCSLFVRYVWINVLHIELMLSPLVPLTEQINVSLVYWFRGQNNTAQMKTLWRARIKAVHKWLPTNLSELKQCAFRQENVLLIKYSLCTLWIEPCVQQCQITGNFILFVVGFFVCLVFFGGCSLLFGCGVFYIYVVWGRGNLSVVNVMAGRNEQTEWWLNVTYSMFITYFIPCTYYIL